MGKYVWKFTMGSKKEPVWEVLQYYNRQALNGKERYLVAYAKRAKDAGWFVRISGLNEDVDSDKLYIGDDVFPPDFMQMMLEMYKHDDH